MPLITLNFPNTVQSSVQINDVAYYVPIKSTGGFGIAGVEKFAKK